MTFEGHVSWCCHSHVQYLGNYPSTETEIANKKSHDSFQMIQLSMTLTIFQGHYTASHQISRKRCVIWQNRKSYSTLAFDWCHFWWPWRAFEGHFSLRCHFHVEFLQSLAKFRFARSLSNSFVKFFFLTNWNIEYMVYWCWCWLKTTLFVVQSARESGLYCTQVFGQHYA